jgi:RND superfamily putative drug exporter
LLPAVLELLGPITWRLPPWIDSRLPHINIEGSSARGPREPGDLDVGGTEERERTPVGR